MIIPVKPPFNFALSARAAASYDVRGVIHDGSLRRLFRAGCGTALVAFSDAGETLSAPAVRAHILATCGDVDEAALHAQIRYVVNPLADRTAFYAFAGAHPALQSTVERLHGLHSFRFENLFEAIMVTVIEQQIALRAAQNAERWLMAWGGDSLDYDGVTYFTFPTPERIASATVEDLTPLKTTFIRMRVLIALAQAAILPAHTSGAVDFAVLRDLPAGAVYKVLMGLKGVGHWTAAWAIIRALGEYVYISSADVALRAAVNHYFYGQSGRADRDVTDKAFAAFGEYEGLAAYYVIMLWAVEREKL